jgi:hemerythrin
VHHPVKCTTTKSHNSLSLNNHKMVNEEDMKAALAEIELSEDPNYREIARKHKLTHTTLLRRAKGLTRSRAEFQSEINQNLNDAQERILIKQINRLTDRDIPPTSKMVKNFAEEMIGREVGKNWVSDFCKRHSSELKSLYLRNIENLRVKSEFGPIYKLFYDLVECFFALLYCTSRETIANTYSSLVTTSY